uniref:Uncharacterized protein n=1 Tax=Macrostomum lignano TaxID=282301 RepID=A0A1I8GMI2_9PLAT
RYVRERMRQHKRLSVRRALLFDAVASAQAVVEKKASPPTPPPRLRRAVQQQEASTTGQLRCEFCHCHRRQSETQTQRRLHSTVNQQPQQHRLYTWVPGFGNIYPGPSKPWESGICRQHQLQRQQQQQVQSTRQRIDANRVYFNERHLASRAAEWKETLV